MEPNWKRMGDDGFGLREAMWLIRPSCTHCGRRIFRALTDTERDNCSASCEGCREQGRIALGE